MSKYKLFPLIIGVAAASFLAGTFVYLKFLPTKINCITSDVSLSPTEEGQPVVREKKFLTYQNREFGFEFKYPSEYVALEQQQKALGAYDFYLPEQSATILKLQNISDRNDYGGTTGNGDNDVFIYAMEKGDNIKVLDALTDKLAQKNKELEDGCVKSPVSCDGESEPDPIYTVGTFAGVDIIMAKMVGTSGEYFRILIPQKGILISGNYKILQEFIFFDRDRVVTDNASGLSFNCLAHWTCNPYKYETYVSYSLEGPEGQLYGLNITASTKKYIENLIDISKRVRGNLRQESFADYVAYFERNRELSIVQIYVPDAGLYLRIDGRSAQSKITRQLEQKFFANSTITAKE